MKYSFKELPLNKDNDQGVSRKVEWGGMTVSVYEIHQTLDFAPLVKGLPGDQCQLPHWGYVLQGRMRCRYGEREEIYTAGDLFYHPPGHTTVLEAGLVYISLTPADEAAEKQRAALQAIRQAGDE